LRWRRPARACEPAGDVDCVAEAGVDVDDQRQVDHAANGHDVIGHQSQIHEAEIRQAEMHIGDAGAGQVHRPEAEIGDDARRERIRRAGQDDAFLLAQHRAQRLDVGCRHVASDQCRTTSTEHLA
jgi:hypothetical protein